MTSNIKVAVKESTGSGITTKFEQSTLGSSIALPVAGETVNGAFIRRDRVPEPPSPYPGPTQLIGGDASAGFYGEVPAEELITGLALATEMNLLSGHTILNSNEPWLKFSLDGRVIYVAKKRYIRPVIWDTLNSRGVIFGQSTILIGSVTYKVRVLKGVLGSSAANTPGEDPTTTHGSEWNRLMYNVHQSIPGSQVGPNWASYTDLDLEVGPGAGTNGTWAQETMDGVAGARISRGGNTVAFLARVSSSSSSYGWRPVLDPIIEGS